MNYQSLSQDDSQLVVGLGSIEEDEQCGLEEVQCLREKCDVECDLLDVVVVVVVDVGNANPVEAL